MQPYLLEGFRVIDLTDEKGFFCGKILGDLGADVIKIERPGGDPARNVGPFYLNIPDSEKSLYWFAYNANKRGITLDIETSDGRHIFNRLVEGADCVIESFPVGYMSKLGIGYSDLKEIKPRIIMVSISPFGQEGPYRDYKASDIIAMGMSGFLYLCGDPDRPPVGTSLPHAYFFAGGDAAAGAMMAYYHREISGEGQWVDVSLQQSAASLSFNSIPWWQVNEVIMQRRGAFRVIGLSGGVLQRQTWPCKDGAVIFLLIGGAFGARTNQALTEWMDQEGMAPAWMKEMDWAALDAAQVDRQFSDRFEEAVGKFFLSHTVAEIYQGALETGMVLYPVADCKELAESPQLRARGFWQEVEHPELDATITYPGAWVKMSEGACSIRRRAPLIGEHNQEIYEGELGLSREELSTLKQAGII